MSHNAWSIRNKVDDIHAFMQTYGTEICFIQESWLRKSDGAIIAEIKELGYEIFCYRRARNIDKGGGVAILVKMGIKLKKFPRRINYSSFEHIEGTLKTNEGTLRFHGCHCHKKS